MKMSAPIKFLTIATLIVAGGYLLGHHTIRSSRPITLEELKFGMTPELAAQITEKDLVVEGQPVQILVITHTLSILWMLGGACLGAAVGFGGFAFINRTCAASTSAQNQAGS